MKMFQRLIEAIELNEMGSLNKLRTTSTAKKRARAVLGSCFVLSSEATHSPFLPTNPPEKSVERSINMALKVDKDLSSFASVVNLDDNNVDEEDLKSMLEKIDIHKLKDLGDVVTLISSSPDISQNRIAELEHICDRLKRDFYPHSRNLPLNLKPLPSLKARVNDAMMAIDRLFEIAEEFVQNNLTKYENLQYITPQEKATILHQYSLDNPSGTRIARPSSYL